ncbi:hypothetical protein AA103196_0286 [Ameyamaea chiangmaiensis NBRC 103196]|nr:hypothetical protein [Ameyamaea chiangmaiensis]MBS4074683.1 hypothetical protein [Ameyamaea chiangmaiensis]GBQ62352.1 hypothetical protein AA103196_0286 [Ameyamaea chiangmaiensis NBRC 103196]
MIRIALIYYGLCRNTAAPAEAIRRLIVAPNHARGVRFTTWGFLNIADRIDNPRTGEIGVALDGGSILDLGCDHYALRRQRDDEIAPLLALCRRTSDPFHDGWVSVGNLLNQLLALRQGWRAFTAIDTIPYDAFLFVRPDLLYQDTLDIPRLLRHMPGPGSVLVPDWHGWGGLNDRAALARPEAARRFACRLDALATFCDGRELHAETFLAWCLAHHRCRVGRLPLRGRRVRANGVVKDEDFSLSPRNLPDRARAFHYDPFSKEIAWAPGTLARLLGRLRGRATRS